ncbi:MAG TPA: hypothetical protein VM901_02150 [Bdellovibrionota bacterium]|jgi:hypothetical protein|nr:hypothetical protein [Bdellovibrionota bacterium]
MRVIGICAIVLAATTASAAGRAPKAGDAAIYMTTYRESPSDPVYTSMWSKEILEKLEDGTFMVAWSTERGEESRTNVSELGLFYIYDLAAFCEAQNSPPEHPAQLETLRIAAGTFRACRITVTNTGVSTQWYASEVPFGLIKEVNLFSDKSVQTLELKKYRR